MPFIHSYRSDMAGVVRMSVVRGGKSFLISRGSNGVSVANCYLLATYREVWYISTLTNLIIFIAIQLLPPSTRRSNKRGAKGRKSFGLLQPSSQTTLMTAAVTLESTSSFMSRSFIFGQAGRNVSGYTSASRYRATMVFFCIVGLE